MVVRGVNSVSIISVDMWRLGIFAAWLTCGSGVVGAGGGGRQKETWTTGGWLQAWT